MIKELFLLPAVLGCSLGGSASTAVRHNVIISDDTYISFEFVLSYGDYFCATEGDYLSLTSSVISSVSCTGVYEDGDQSWSSSYEEDTSTFSLFVETNISPLTWDIADFGGLDLVVRSSGADEWYFHVSPDVSDFVGTYSVTYDTDLESNVLQVPPPISHNGVAIVNEIVSVLVSGLTALGTGIGLGISNFAQALAFSNGQLSVYFVLVVAFAAVALAVGLTSRLFQWLTSLGN